MRIADAHWSPEFVVRMEESVLSDETIRNLVALKLTEERAAKFLKICEDNPDKPFSKMTMKWARPMTELGIRAVPGPNGLGSHEVNIGTYGEVPDHWPYENDTPLGSHPTPGQYMPGSYTVFDKSEVWAEGVDILYDDAIRERWIPATDIAWTEIGEMPDDIERAICQVCTSFSAHGLAESKTLGAWEEKIAYGFHDVKTFIGTWIFDAGRKVEALRKRSVANSGGVGVQGLGTLYRAWFGALKTTELLTAIGVVYKSYEVVAFQRLAEVLPSPVDRDLFSRLAHDSERHLEFGRRHLKYYVQHHPDSREFLEHFLNRAESALADELNHSPSEAAALAVLLGGGVEKLTIGVAKLRELREDQLRKYVEILDWCSLDRLPRINPGLLALAREEQPV